MPKRPLLNYFGGKWNAAPKIIPHFPEHKLYVEPFGGSLSVLLRKPRSKKEIVNDVDQELANLYFVARDSGADLKEKLKLTPHSRSEYRLSMIKTDDKLEMARRSIVRCYFGIGDSFLWNHNAFRNSKDSNICVAKSWDNYCQAFDGIIERLRGVTIENLSYEKLFEKYDSLHTLWYLDPPYPPMTRSRKHAYREDWDNLKHLQFLGEIKNLNGHVVVSSYANDLYDADLKDWKRIEFESTVNGAKKRIEILWIKNVS